MGTEDDTGGLEAAVIGGASYVSPEIEAENKALIIKRVCRIEMMSAAVFSLPEPLGTGFIVGESCVLTNAHVIEAARARGGVDKLLCRFDYGVPAGGLARRGRTVKVAGIIMEKPCSPAERTINPDATQPTEHELDFALLKLAEPIGAERGLIALPDVQPKLGPNERLYIAQHPEGGPIQFADDTPGVIGLFHDGRRLRYRTLTTHGSSGSPVFSRDFKLVALHHLGDPKYKIRGAAEYNQGVPIALITRSIIAAGHDALIAPLQDDVELEVGKKDGLIDSIQTAFGIPDYDSVFKRYLGHIVPGEIMPGRVLNPESSSNAYEKARRERLLREYLGRVLEQKWSEAGLRSQVLIGVETLARPVSVLDHEVADICDGFDALWARISEDEVVRTIGPHTSVLWIMADLFRRLELLKGLHEALRNLQVKGADWLVPGTTMAKPADEFAALLTAVVTAAKAACDQVILPEAADPEAGMLAQEYAATASAMKDLCGDSAIRLEPIAKRFLNHSHAGTEKGKQDLMTVRGILAGQSAEPSRIAAPLEAARLVFAICRDLPLKGLRKTFQAAEAIERDGKGTMRIAARATVALSDALRRRAVEQALWQEIDGWLYEAEDQISANDAAAQEAVMLQLASLFRKIQANVARLDATRPDGKRITEDCGRAIHTYFQYAQSAVKPDLKPEDLLSNVEDCFAALALVARSRMRSADQAFFADCVRIAPVSGKILQIYEEISLKWIYLP